MTEDDLLRAVLDLAKVLKWRTLHIRPARTDKGWRSPVQGDGAGWPDLFLVKGNRALAAELKGSRGSLTAAQWDWLAALDSAGIETAKWTPADWPEPIHSILGGKP